MLIGIGILLSPQINDISHEEEFNLDPFSQRDMTGNSSGREVVKTSMVKDLLLTMCISTSGE